MSIKNVRFTGPYEKIYIKVTSTLVLIKNISMDSTYYFILTLQQEKANFRKSDGGGSLQSSMKAR